MKLEILDLRRTNMSKPLYSSVVSEWQSKSAGLRHQVELQNLSLFHEPNWISKGLLVELF